MCACVWVFKLLERKQKFETRKRMNESSKRRRGDGDVSINRCIERIVRIGYVRAEWRKLALNANGLLVSSISACRSVSMRNSIAIIIFSTTTYCSRHLCLSPFSWYEPKEVSSRSSNNFNRFSRYLYLSFSELAESNVLLAG